jgi:hypothetical protein
MKKTLLSMLACLITVSLIGSATALAADLPGARRIEIMMPDSLQLVAWLTPSPSEKPAPLAALLPMYAHDHTSFDLLIAGAYALKSSDSANKLPPLPHFLAFDLRGHGESQKKGSTETNYADRDSKEYVKIPGDVARMIMHVLRDSTVATDDDNVFLVGASIGANSAVMATAQLPKAARVVMLSPGETYLGLEPRESFKEFDGICLIYVGEKDAYSKRSSEWLAAIGGDKVKLEVFQGKDHGTDIINNNPKAMAMLIEWLF